MREFVFNPASLKSNQVCVCMISNPRSGRYVVRVLNEQLVRVTIPRKGTRKDAMAFFLKHRQWVLTRLEEMEHRRRREETPWREGTQVWFRGRKEPLRLREKGKRHCVVIGDLEIELDFADDLKREILSGLRAKANLELPQCVKHWSEKTGLCPKRISVRNQKTRWGSCSSKGSISLNWHLLQVPFEVRDYVIIHELCHLRFLNHSRQFWKSVQAICPHYRQHIRWLKEHEGQIISS